MSTAMLKAGLVLLVAVSGVSGHGYMKSPPSRAYLCSETVGLNQNCGIIADAPQDLEGNDGWPSGGPADGTISAAGKDKFSELNVQSSSRWSKFQVAPGPTSFTWQFTKNHNSTGFAYYLTKEGWNADAPLSRAAFDLTPFCTAPGGVPPMTVTHPCTMPQRQGGYHIVLAVWDVADTRTFYNVIDAVFPQVAPPATTETGDAPKHTLPIQRMRVATKKVFRLTLGVDLAFFNKDWLAAILGDALKDYAMSVQVYWTCPGVACSATGCPLSAMAKMQAGCMCSMSYASQQRTASVLATGGTVFDFGVELATGSNEHEVLQALEVLVRSPPAAFEHFQMQAVGTAMSDTVVVEPTTAAPSSESPPAQGAGGASSGDDKYGLPALIISTCLVVLVLILLVVVFFLSSAVKKVEKKVSSVNLAKDVAV
eukprot:TRINITY_DN24815_c0_g1_i1.p1 TRINITY_DN24815_c0_g1~~TRINITY_DN24815_c0_g1_i1.p1  ORF type:complete len:425 (+),score=175.02 TRINITY_DN24815_c0_g1_i1:126-1400(+)